MKSITIALCLLWVSASSQDVSYLHGTKIAAFCLRDTLLMVADSRAAIGDQNTGNIVAYIDSVPKILQLKSYLLTFDGGGAFGSKTMSGVVQEFNKSHPKYIDFHNCVLIFQHYMDSLYPTNKYPSEHVFIAGGFFNNRPEVIKFDRGLNKADLSKFKTMSGVVNDGRFAFYIPRYNELILWITTDSLSRLVEKAIYSIAKDSNKESTVGGPVSIVKMVRPDKIIWKQNNFTKNLFPSIAKLLNLIKQKKLVLVPVEENGEAKALEILKRHQ